MTLLRGGPRDLELQIGLIGYNSDNTVAGKMKNTNDNTSEIVISSFSEFTEEIEKLDKSYTYVYRGLRNKNWANEPSINRRLQDCDQGNLMRILDATKKLLRDFNDKNYDLANKKPIYDLHVLAHLQHYGAATCLIDYTYNPKKALWFSMGDPKEKYRVDLPDSKVSIVKIDEKYQLVNFEMLKENISFFFNNKNCDNPIYYWEPDLPFVNMRIKSQESVFLFGCSQVLSAKDIIIPTQYHREIKESLELINITKYSLFNDVYTFAERHSHTKNLEHEKFDALIKEAAKTGLSSVENRKKCIDLLTQAIEINNKSAEVYFKRGWAYSLQANPNNSKELIGCNLREDWRNSLSDYNKAIDLDAENSNYFSRRSDIHRNLGNINEQIQDMKNCVKLDPSPHNLISLSQAYTANRQYELALKVLGSAELQTIIDPKPGSPITQLHFDFYNTRGIVYFHIAKYNEARKDFTDAIAKLEPLPISKSLYHSQTYFSRCITYLALGEWEYAILDSTLIKKCNKCFSNILTKNFQTIDRLESNINKKIPQYVIDKLMQ